MAASGSAREGASLFIAEWERVVGVARRGASSHINSRTHGGGRVENPSIADTISIVSDNGQALAWGSEAYVGVSALQGELTFGMPCRVS